MWLVLASAELALFLFLSVAHWKALAACLEPGGLTKKVQSCLSAFCCLVEKETQVETVVLILS